jgi:phosphinothricin acetyltransferase
VYVDRSQRGRGIGRALLAELLTLASAHGFHSVIARIAGHNETSIGLHRAAGFELVGVEREVGRKHRQWLDVVELQRLL